MMPISTEARGISTSPSSSADPDSKASGFFSRASRELSPMITSGAALLWGVSALCSLSCEGLFVATGTDGCGNALATLEGDGPGSEPLDPNPVDMLDRRCPGTIRLGRLPRSHSGRLASTMPPLLLSITGVGLGLKEILEEEWICAVGDVMNVFIPAM